jgi:hypothetical protein
MNMIPIGNVGALPFANVGLVPNYNALANVGALGRRYQNRQANEASRELRRQLELQQDLMEEQRKQNQAIANFNQQQQMLGAMSGYNVAQNPGVMPIQSPYAANIPGGNPFAPSPASPPVSPPANARPVPLGAPAAVQMAAISGSTPGTATLTFTSQDPFWLYDLYIECETQNLAYVESLTLGSQNIRAGNGGIQPATYWAASNFNQGKLQGYFINSTQSLVVVVRNLSGATNWCMGTCSGASVR